MPFDNTDNNIKLRALAGILRDRSRWPTDFTWNYENCETCAMGLAWQLTDPTCEKIAPLHITGNISYTEFMALQYNVPYHIAQEIFVDLPDYLSSRAPHYMIAPEDVATAIDTYLAGRWTSKCYSDDEEDD